MTVLLRGRSKLKRSGGKRVCPICQGDGCGQSESMVICWRVQEGAIKEAVNGAWVHKLDGQSSPVECRSRFETPLAAIERRHAVYSAMMAMLELNQKHRTHLEQSRRLSIPAITRAEFRSVPSWSLGDAIAGQLAKKWELKGVPGFWRKEGRWVLRFAGMDGFYIPIRNHVGQIEALQIRTMSDDKHKRYFLVSTSTDNAEGFTDGVSSGAPAHFTRFQGEEIYITEGALKAEVIADQLKKPVVGLVAVGTFRDEFGLQLRQWRPSVRTVRIAFDSDWRTNEKVKKQMARLSESLKRGGFAVKVEQWEGAKGFDDYLLRPKR